MSAGHVETALVIADAVSSSEPDEREEIRAEALERAEREDSTAVRIETGKMGSNRTPADYREVAACFRDFAARLKDT